MLCPRPISIVPYREACDDTMRLKHDGLWHCPCGTVVKLSPLRVVPSHTIPAPATQRRAVRRLRTLLQLVTPSRRARVLRHLLKEISLDKPA